ncbi:MAG: DUF3757 domain-containing protein [Legionella sp.]
MKNNVFIDVGAMKSCYFILLGLLLSQLSVQSHATLCPDPNTTSLKWGIPPEPWTENPFSTNRPQGEANTQFVRVNILVAEYGRGVLCTYRNSVGEYAIWWQVSTKIPSRMDYNWIKTLGGFVCTQCLEQCSFFTA